MLTLYLSEYYAKKDLLLVRLRPSVANAIIGTELILITLPPGTSSLRADPTFLLPSQADAERREDFRQTKIDVSRNNWKFLSGKGSLFH